MKQLSDRRCYYYHSSIRKGGPGQEFLQHTSALLGREIYGDFHSFHLRTIQLEWLQTLGSGNVHLGIKECRQPCTEHDKITRALFSLPPEAGK